MLPPRDLENYWAEFDTKNVVRREIIHSGSRKKLKKSSPFQPKTFCPDPVPPLYKIVALSLLDRFYSNFGSRRINQS